MVIACNVSSCRKSSNEAEAPLAVENSIPEEPAVQDTRNNLSQTVVDLYFETYIW